MDRDKVQVHNIGEERNVGLFNYEIVIRGKKNFEAASRRTILNRSLYGDKCTDANVNLPMAVSRIPFP